MTNYLEVTNLSKSFDSFQLHNISFTLPKGYIMGLIGPNGSGKTTTIKLILNMLKRTGGTVKVMGLDNIAEEQKVKSELGVVFDTNYFSDDWKVSQVEKSISVFYPNWDSQKFADMLRKFHIAPTKKVKELSKGMQMKLMLACAFSYDAKLLILDEPTSGLDPVSRDELLKILSEYIEDGEHSVLFSTHITGDLERAADYITYISYGELYFTGSKDDFVDKLKIQMSAKRQEIEKTRRLIRGLYENFVQGILTNDEYFELKADYEHAINALSGEIEVFEKSMDSLDNQLARYRAMEKDAKTLAQDHVLTAELIERLIERIEIDHERNIHVTFRFKNEFQGKAVEPCATM